MHYHIVVNPASSSGQGLENWKNIEPCFKESGHTFKVYYSSPDRSIRDIVSDITKTEKKIRLVVIGGDGSLNEAVNGIRDPEKVLFGFIPVGSGNDLALSLGLPKNQKKILSRILKGRTRRLMDVGELTYYNKSHILDPVTHLCDEEAWDQTECEDHVRFNISAGLGFDASCCQGANASSLKRVLNVLGLGKLVYLGIAIREILTAPMEKVTLTLEDGRVIEKHRCLLAVAMNQPYQGGGFKFCPDADDRDGKLDLCLAADLNRLSFFYIFPTVYGGRHFAFKGVEGGRCSSLTIESAHPMWVHTDGEVICKSSKVSIRILDKKLRLMV